MIWITSLANMADDAGQCKENVMIGRVVAEATYTLGREWQVAYNDRQRATHNLYARSLIQLCQCMNLPAGRVGTPLRKNYGCRKWGMHWLAPIVAVMRPNGGFRRPLRLAALGTAIRP
jgi:hypothetical protein